MNGPSGLFCPQCGTRNVASAVRCQSCQQPLPQRAGTAGSIPPGNDPSLQETQVIRPPAATVPVESFPVAPPVVRQQPVPPKSRLGCVLGLVSLLCICSLVGVLLWLVGRPLFTNSIKAQVSQGIATQVADVDQVPVQSSGEVIVTEAEINQNVQAYQGALGPLKNPRVTIGGETIGVQFDLYGTTTTYRGGLAVHGGKITVTDPKVSGPAGALLSANDLAEILEKQLASVLARSGVRPTSVQIQTGRIVIDTEPR
ncbi:MAG TPA: LmeA family phospholipid-binding protein [Thermomicrobiales bacterium]|nr:LmeA family phospholipid-binding protein [Thermomicrobiales bacterium]